MVEGAKSNLSSNKCDKKTIMALKPNQLQVTTYHPQANEVIERVHRNQLSMTCSDHLTWKKKTIMNI
jgi:hypothetical protein